MSEMLSVLGRNESVVNISACCNICTRGKVDSTRLNVLIPTSQKRTRKPKPMWLKHILTQAEGNEDDTEQQSTQKKVDLDYVMEEN